jgi:enoyl-CoA hydratase
MAGLDGTEHCVIERHGPVVVVVMNRPEAKNALSPAMLVGLADAWEAIDADDTIRCAILTGAGGDFSTGMDLKAFTAGGDNPYRERFQAEPDLHWRALLRHYHLRKPLIAAVEGYAVAGGTEMLLATDVRVASREARFGLFEARRALFPLGGSTVRLARQIPYTVAMDILLTGRQVSAEEAHRVGLVGHLVEPGKALDEAMDFAGAIARNGPLAVEAIKRSVRAGDCLPEDEALAQELEIGTPIFATEDAREGAQAFAERREPLYQRR